MASSKPPAGVRSLEEARSRRRRGQPSLNDDLLGVVDGALEATRAPRELLEEQLREIKRRRLDALGERRDDG